MTRIRFRSIWTALIALARLAAMYRTARGAVGFVRGSASLSDPFTVVNLSMWTDERSMLLWSGNDAHVAAVRWTYRRRVEAWSAIWALEHQSASASRWTGELELRVEHGARRNQDPSLLV